MDLSIRLPDDIASDLETRWGDLPRRTLEALAVQAFREGLLSKPKVQRLLDLDSRIELDGFLKKNSIFLEYDEQDLEMDRRTLDEVHAR